MDDFTKRLLEKKNARKRKQEEASAALKNINVQSDAKRSPVKNRHPLAPKNDNDTVGARLPPVAKPRTDISAERKESPTKRRHNNARSPSSKNLEEILDSGRKSQVFTNARHSPGDARKRTPNSVDSQSESVQQRVARLQYGTPQKDEVPTRNRNGSLPRKNSCDTPTEKNEHASASISDRLAMFETSGKGNASRSQQHRTGDQKRMHESRKHTEGASKCAKNESEGHRLSGKLQKTSTMRESLNKNEAPSPLSPKLASISAVNESSDLDYQSDENPFDISSILRAANEGESQTPEAVEYKKASWDVLDYLTEDSPKLAESPKRIVSPKRSASSKVVARSPAKYRMDHVENKISSRQRDSLYSNQSDEESLSGFGKEISKKRHALKSSGQEDNLKRIDASLDNKAMDAARNETAEAKSREERRVDAKMHERKVTHSKHERHEEKRRAPRVPESERTTVNHSETKKVKRAGKPTVDEVTQENRQPPPKPPRKAKLSVEDVVYDAPMENDIQKPVPEDDLYAPIEGNGQSEGKKDGSRKRYKNDGACFDEFGSYEKASVQDSLGKYDDCPGNEDIATKKKKQSRKQNANLEVEKDPDPVVDVLSKAAFSPNSQAYKSVREKKANTNRKGMRRSMSFSEGQSPVVPIIHKSGYNEEASSKYNVVTNCHAPAHDEAQNSSDKIKELLEYAVSQQNIVLQASQALNLSLNGDEKRGCPEIIEGERLLLLATQRRTACLDEVELLKQPNYSGHKKKRHTSCPPCKATIVISEINLPLNGDFLVALRGGRMDLGVFHFVVLIQHGPTQIYSTKVRCTYDELSRNYIAFKDKIILKDVSHDFLLTIKVFGMHTKRANDVIHKGKKTGSKESPGLMKNMFSSLTPKRRINSDDSPVRGSSPKPVFRTTNFTAVGSATINLTNCGAGKFVLNQVPKNCPLDGFIESKIDCVPEFTASARGFLTLLEEVGGYTAWNRRWCVMQGDLISFWRFPDEEDQKPPTDTIDLRMCSNQLVDVVPRMECSRPNTFELNVKRPLSKHDTPSLLSTIEGKVISTKHWLSADNKDDRVAWIEVLNRQLSDSKAWSTNGFKSKSMAGKSAAYDSSRRQRGGVVPV